MTHLVGVTRDNLAFRVMYISYSSRFVSPKDLDHWTGSGSRAKHRIFITPFSFVDPAYLMIKLNP